MVSGPRGAGGAGAGGRGGGAGRAGGTGATGTDTESQRFLREQERSLIDFIRRQAEQRQEAGGRGGRGGRGGAEAPADIVRDSAADVDVASDPWWTSSCPLTNGSSGSA